MLNRCPACESTDLHRKRVHLTRKVAGHAFTALLPAQVCGGCGEPYFAAADVTKMDIRVALELLAAGESSGKALRYIRKSIGLGSGELAALLDVRAETVSRWENGKRPIDRGSFAVLHQLALDRLHGTSATADYLRSLKRPRKLPRTVRLDGKVAA